MAQSMLPYIPVAPERQPQGGLLQGLEEGLERLKRENEMRKQLQMRDEFETRHQERQGQQQLLMQREQVAGQLAMEEQKQQQRMAEAQQRQELEQQREQLFQQFLNSPSPDEPPSAKPPRDKRLGILDMALGGASQVTGLPLQQTSRIANIIRDKAEPDQPRRTSLDYIQKAQDINELRATAPRTLAFLSSTEQGRQLLSTLPKERHSQADTARPYYTMVAQSPEKFDAAAIQAIPELSADEKVGLIRFHQAALAAANAGDDKERRKVLLNELGAIDKDKGRLLTEANLLDRDIRKETFQKPTATYYWEDGKRIPREDELDDEELADEVAAWSQKLDGLRAQMDDKRRGIEATEARRRDVQGLAMQKGKLGAPEAASPELADPLGIR